MRFCEECGAQLEDDAKFCEECGAEQEPLLESTESAVEQKPLTVENELLKPNVSTGCDSADSNTTVRKKKWIYPIVFVVLVLAAGMAGYLFGHKNNTEKNVQQEIAQEPTVIPQTTPTLTVEPKATAIPTPIVEPKATATPTPTAAPKLTATSTPTPVSKPTATPTQVPAGSVFEDFFAEYESSVWQLQTPDGIWVNLNSDPRAQSGCIIKDDHSFYFTFEELLVGTDAAPVVYTFLGEAGQIDPEYGYYDELQLSFTNQYVTIYWAYHAGKTVEVLYNNRVSTEYAKCRSVYVSYGERTMEKLEAVIEKQVSDDLFRTIKNGELWSVDLYADSEEDISVGLSYNAQTGSTVIELYQYDESEHLFGVTTKEVGYDKEERYYFVPRFSEGDFWGEPMQALSEYEMYYMVNLNISEDGIRLKWVFYENEKEKVLYDGMIDIGFMERRVSIINY